MIASQGNNDATKKEIEMLFLEGIDLYDRNKYDEASKCFEKAIELNLNNVDAWYGKGNALYELKKKKL
jgi:tetratricopeptide (TPR) repeat protein